MVVRIVIADDSVVARELLRAHLAGVSDFEVVGEAADGVSAVDCARALHPDVMTMDLEMPRMGGLDAIDAIMHERAVPILVVSAFADAHNAMHAIDRGALDVIAKPQLDGTGAAELVGKLRLLAGVSVITRMRPRSASPAAVSAGPAVPVMPAAPPLAAAASGSAPGVLAIASSTGGPRALNALLSALPATFPLPVVIAQHISDGFAAGLASWLDGGCALTVRLAGGGEVLRAGEVWLSPSEASLRIEPDGRLGLRARQTDEYYHPNCDVLLGSAAEVFGRRAIGLIMTGMGHDGAAGLAQIRKAGGGTFAQDEASSVVFGMNRVAIEQGAAEQVLPLDALAARLCRSAVGLCAGAAG